MDLRELTVLPTPPHIVELDRLGDEIAELAAHLDAASARLLDLIREFDARGGWANGCRSCAEWLSWRTGLAPGAAREHVRVARALGTLPKIRAALARGEISYSKVRAITRVATPETEERLLNVARCGTAAHVERIVRGWRWVDRHAEQQDTAKRHLHRFLRVYEDEDGMVVVRGRLTPELGAVLKQALAAARETLYQRRRRATARAGATPDTPATSDVPAGTRDVSAGTPNGSARTGDVSTGADGVLAGAARVPAGTSRVPEERTYVDGSPEAPTLEQQDADALALIAEAALHHELDPGAPGERYQVVVHVDAAVLENADGPGQSVLEGGARVSAETSQRLGCDASRVLMRHDADGRIVEVGARTRTIPPAIRRALHHRDRGCRFPGCSVRFGQGHHIKHWAQGGPTTLSNLTMLCRRHHRAVHEEGYQVERQAGGELTFSRPDGLPLPDVPWPPRVPRDPVASLRARNEAEGLHIDGKTSLPNWAGERLDLGWAISVMHPLASRPSIPAADARAV